MTPRLVLDTGALIALEHGDARAFLQLKLAADRGFVVVVATSVVLEAFAGSQNPQLIRPTALVVRDTVTGVGLAPP